MKDSFKKRLAESGLVITALFATSRTGADPVPLAPSSPNPIVSTNTGLAPGLEVSSKGPYPPDPHKAPTSQQPHWLFSENE